MTYSIAARDETTGQMGVACASQAFAVGSSVPWALAGYGVVATQSMGEPMYGQLGLDALQAGLTATEALTALRSVDPHPARRQVAMVDSYGGIDVYTGDACVPEAGHRIGDRCAALANLVESSAVWDAMIEAFEAAADALLPDRLLAALRAGEEAGGDVRGRRSASVVVVRATRTGRPWRDQLIDLRVDDHTDPVAELGRLVRIASRYHRVVGAFEAALDGRAEEGLEQLAGMRPPDPGTEPDMTLWSAVVFGLAGERDHAAELMRELERASPTFVEAARRFRTIGVVEGIEELDRVLPGT